MLLFSAHLFFIYANFALNESMISLQSTINIGIILLLISGVLHLVNFWKPVTLIISKSELDVDERIFDKYTFNEDE
jgi:hypothetical protein